MKQQTSLSKTSVSLNDWLLIILLAGIWGGSFLFGRILMIEWPPMTVVFLRVFLAAVTLWLFLWITKKQFPKDVTLIKGILVMGILNNVIPFSLILIGQKEIGSGLAAVVNAMTPIWTLIIANSFTADEKFSKNKIAGITLGFLGVAILIGADFIQGFTASAWAQGAVLGATISYGFAGVWGKRFKRQDPIIVSTGQLTASSLIMLPLVFILEEPFSLSTPSIEMLISLLALAILCTSFAYVLYFKILSSAGATHASLVTFLVPISAIVLGIIWLNETLTTSNILGMILIILGLALIDGRVLKMLNS